MMLIALERDEQLEKHGFSIEKDRKYYLNNELLWATLCCLMQDPNLKVHPGTADELWPPNWGEEYLEKIKAKDRIGQLKVAGALIAAELDRLTAGTDYVEIEHNQVPLQSEIKDLCTLKGIIIDEVHMSPVNSHFIGKISFKLDENRSFECVGPLGENNGLFFVIELFNDHVLNYEITSWELFLNKVDIMLGNVPKQ